jgi:hypothetical protein
MLNLIISEANSLLVCCRFVLSICRDFMLVSFIFCKYADVILNHQFAAVAATTGLTFSISY